MTWEDTDKGIDIDIIVDYIDMYNPMVVLLVYTYDDHLDDHLGLNILPDEN